MHLLQSTYVRKVSEEGESPQNKQKMEWADWRIGGLADWWIGGSAGKLADGSSALGQMIY